MAGLSIVAGEVSERLSEIRERIGAAARVSGRTAGEVEIVAAIKYVANEELGALADAGVERVGENRAQELVAKQDRWGDRFVWDFIGHLQSRKVKDVVDRVTTIHSIDSLSAVKQLAAHGGPLPKLLLQVNLAGESSKSGVAPAEVDAFLSEVEKFEPVSFRGLMTMPPLATEPEQARPHFVALRELAERLNTAWRPRHLFGNLSMGTSQDFAVAVEEGATTVRIGSTLYGGILSFRAKLPR